jgi:hypothetical protein
MKKKKFKWLRKISKLQIKKKKKRRESTAELILWLGVNFSILMDFIIFLMEVIHEFFILAAMCGAEFNS